MKKILILLLLASFVSCKSDNDKVRFEKKSSVQLIPTEKVELFRIDKPKNLDTITYGSSVDFKIILIDSLKEFDSVQVFLNNKRIHASLKCDFSIEITPEKVGVNVIGIKAFLEGELTQIMKIRLFVLSDIEPKNMSFRVLRTYKHSTENFTQGLVFNNGLLYESTGNWGKSAIFISDLETGEVFKSAYLSTDKFGEGIAILRNRIILLTYKSAEGYIYDKQSCLQIGRFEYPFYTEGWGLSSSQKGLLMSNGTDKIFVLDSTSYTLLDEFTICDNKESIDSLNELEYVQGLLYSNVWMSNKIVQIDMKSGKVLGYIDLTNIIPKKYRNHHSNVLNGIAYNDLENSLLVTGKHWDRIYEILIADEP
jgi:glutamine cyclotransferase